MDTNEQNTTQPKRRSALVEAVTGGAIGAVIGGITSLFNKKWATKKQIGLGAIAGAAFGLLSNLFAKKPVEQPVVPAATPPAVPPIAEYPQGLTLGGVPQILDLLVVAGQLNQEQKNTVLTSIKNGHKGFAAEIAVANGMVTKAQADEALSRQSMMKAEAAVSDIQNIKDFGSIPAPAYLHANWGNNGVNPIIVNPTRIDGISAASNIAQNLVMLANANPALAPIVFNGVIAAASLANGIANGDSAVTPLAKMSAAWKQTMNDAITSAAQANPQMIVDANGKPIDINSYIAARNAEITAAVQQALAPGQNRDQGQAR
jgi:hypothetical protein